MTKSKILSAVSFIALMVMFSCTKEEQININEYNQQAETRSLSNPSPVGFYDVVNYSCYPNMTILEYTVKARKNSVWDNYPSKKTGWGAVKIMNIQTYRNNLPSVIRMEFDYFISDLNNPIHWPKWFVFSNGQKYVIYRNWTYSATKPKPFIIRNPQDMRFSTTSPFYYMNDGGFISCNLNATAFITFGVPQKIVSFPSTLKFTQEWDTSNPGHIGIKPVNNNITQPNLQAQLDLIQVEIAQ
jgi:hypothetical protein